MRHNMAKEFAIIYVELAFCVLMILLFIQYWTTWDCQKIKTNPITRHGYAPARCIGEVK